MKLMIIRLGLLGATAMGLTACGGGGSIGVTPPPSPPPSLESKFGTGFATDFDAAANSQPAKPVASDIIPLSLTAQPIPLH